MNENLFDHERDIELGALLRAHLDADQHAAFVARVRAGIRVDAGAGPFEVLGTWLRPGIAAAALVALTAGWWLTSGTRAEVASTTPVEVFAEDGGTELMLATALEGR